MKEIKLDTLPEKYNTQELKEELDGIGEIRIEGDMYEVLADESVKYYPPVAVIELKDASKEAEVRAIISAHAPKLSDEESRIKLQTAELNQKIAQTDTIKSILSRLAELEGK